MITNSLGLIKSGPGAFVGFITFRTSSTSFSHNFISLIWFATCDKFRKIEFAERQNILITPCIGINIGKSEMKLQA
jgi:hypothetical protein